MLFLLLLLLCKETPSVFVLFVVVEMLLCIQNLLHNNNNNNNNNNIHTSFRRRVLLHSWAQSETKNTFFSCKYIMYNLLFTTRQNSQRELNFTSQIQPILSVREWVINHYQALSPPASTGQGGGGGRERGKQRGIWVALLGRTAKKNSTRGPIFSLSAVLNSFTAKDKVSVQKKSFLWPISQKFYEQLLRQWTCAQKN